MPNPSSSNIPFPNFERIHQRTASHCGPACLTMFTRFLGKNIDQDQFVEEAGLNWDQFLKYGMTIHDMARAINILAPDLVFWYKTDVSISELARITEEFKYPVGVEWQGVFDGEDDFEDQYSDDDYEDDDEGHYSVVVHVSTKENLIRLIDPYFGKDKEYSIREFENRWWDENVVVDPRTNRQKDEYDNHLVFLVTPKGVSFPEELGMIRS